MQKFLLLLTLVTTTSFAGFEKVTVKNLDLDYISPGGQGMVERVGIGMSFNPVQFPIEITKTDDSFELTSPYVDFTWKHPLKFIYDLNSVVARKTSASLGTKTHFVESEYFMFKSKDKNEYKAEKLKASCEGRASGSFDVRLMEDCRKKMELTIKRVDVPSSFILARLARELPVPPEAELDIPADNVALKINNGNYALQVYIKFWFYAGLRAWGHMQYENDYKTIAIRVDQVKFGYLPVTNLVMKKLKELIKSPDVKVDPPWIRINTRMLYENQ